MKLGVVIAVSKYSGSGLSDLPGCAQDANLVHTILGAQEGYQEILSLTTNTNSAEVKQHLIEFVNKYKGNAISEFVYYFTGHGVFLKNEYYYLFSDYQSSKLRQTALENTELDNLIRSLNPSLTTKVVDSCQSGLPYIKDSAEIDLYLKGTQSGFQNCYFLFSSHTDESSYQDNALSAFTRTIGELVASRTGIVRHKDIIDYVSDSFAANTLQTPFFVVQADFTDQFCKVDSTLQKKVEGILASATHPSVASKVSLTAETTLKALVEADAMYYCTKEEASAALTRLSAHLAEYEHPAEVQDLYKFEVLQLPDYSSIPNLEDIGKWLKESKDNVFAEPTYKRVKVKRPKSTFLSTLSALSLTRITLKDDDYEDVIENRISGVKSTTEMPYACLTLRATALYPNLNSTVCFFVPFVSRTHVLLFAGMVSYVARGWEEEAMAGEIKWRPFEERIKDNTGIVNAISAVMNDFWEFTMTPAKKKFGIVKEDAESHSGNNLGKKDSGEQKDAHNKK